MWYNFATILLFVTLQLNQNQMFLGGLKDYKQFFKIEKFSTSNNTKFKALCVTKLADLYDFNFDLIDSGYVDCHWYLKSMLV